MRPRSGTPITAICWTASTTSRRRRPRRSGRNWAWISTAEVTGRFSGESRPGFQAIAWRSAFLLAEFRMAASAAFFAGGVELCGESRHITALRGVRQSPGFRAKNGRGRLEIIQIDPDIRLGECLVGEVRHAAPGREQARDLGGICLKSLG